MLTTLASDADVLTRIKSFCKQHDMAETTFGRRAIGDASLVANLEAGRSLTLKTAGRIVSFMLTFRPSTDAVAA